MLTQISNNANCLAKSEADSKGTWCGSEDIHNPTVPEHYTNYTAMSAQLSQYAVALIINQVLFWGRFPPLCKQH